MSTLGSVFNLPKMFFGVALTFLSADILWFIFGSRVEPSDLIDEDIDAPGVSLAMQGRLNFR